jgi:hypothetical protein
MVLKAIHINILLLAICAAAVLLAEFSELLLTIVPTWLYLW